MVITVDNITNNTKVRW